METEKVLARIEENLKRQKKYKSDLNKANAKLGDIELKIQQTTDEFNKNIYELNEMSVNLKEVSTNKLMEILDNLSPVYAGEQGFCGGLCLTFVGKTYQITNLENSNISNNKSGKNFLMSIVEDTYDAYFEKGDEIFCKSNIEQLQKLVENYNNKKNIVTNTLVDGVVKSKTNQLKEALDDVKNKYYTNKDNLLTIQQKLSTMKDYKSIIAKKVFGNKEEVTKEHDQLAELCITQEGKIKELTAKLNDKQGLIDDSKKYVEKELNALLGVFSWMENLKENKNRLQSFEEKNINVLADKLNELDIELNDTKTDIVEAKGSLQLNKKVNAEIVDNALRNENFKRDFKNIDVSKLNENQKLAYKFVEKKDCANIKDFVNNNSLR